MILIVGSNEETHCAHIFNALLSKGQEVCYFDSRKYPNEILLNFSPNSNDGYLKIEGRKILIQDIQGIYWRWFYGVEQSFIQNDFTSKMVYRERFSALNSFFLSVSCNFVNSYKAIELHKTKVYQLNIMAKNNIRVPKTVTTNDSDALIEFYEKNSKNVIFKPVLGGAFTKRLTDQDITKENLKTLKTSPVQLQEYIEGEDIRVYTIGDKIYAAKMKSKTLDFREDEASKPIPVELPEEIKQNCKKVLDMLYLAYSGIDIRKTKDDEYVFIEANPAPMFIYFEKVTNYPITQSLIELLLK